MFTVSMALEILICILLIVVILMQSSKGGGLAGIFGGGNVGWSSVSVERPIS